MSAIALTESDVRLVYPNSPSTVVRTFKALVALPTVGLSVYLDPTTGKIGLCDANDSGKEQFLGIALRSANINDDVRVLLRGEVAGFTVSALNYGVLVFQGDTPGVLDTAASGTKTVQVGRVMPVNDPDRTKLLYIQSDLIRNW